MHQRANSRYDSTVGRLSVASLAKTRLRVTWKYFTIRVSTLLSDHWSSACRRQAWRCSPLAMSFQPTLAGRPVNWQESSAACADVQQQLDEYFAGRRREFTMPLDLRGTDFQRECWEQLLSIPYGETRSYGEIARAVKRPNAYRAVGQSNHHNPVAIIVPCHRVLAGGKASGWLRRRTADQSISVAPGRRSLSRRVGCTQEPGDAGVYVVAVSSSGVAASNVRVYSCFGAVTICSVVPNSTISPCFITAMRVAR